MQSEITVADGRQRVRLWAWGDGAPLLFLHGFEGHPGDAPFLADLARSRRVLAPELPGFGESHGLDGLTELLDVTLYQRELVETLGYDRVDVVGHSLGGMLAAELAAVCPSLVERLVLVDAYGVWLDDLPIPDPFVLSPSQLARTLWHDVDSEPAQARLVEREGGRPRTEVLLERARNLGAAGKFLWPIPDRGLARRLRLIRAPTLVVWGAEDQLIDPRYGAEFRDRIPGAQLIMIPNAGHLPMLEQPAAFLEAVEPFLGA